MQMAFARHKCSGYERVGKMFFQHLVRAAKNNFRLVTCRDIIVHGEVVLDAARFCISPVLSKEKSIC